MTENGWAYARSVAYLLIWLYAVRVWWSFETSPAVNGGKFTLRMVLMPLSIFMVASMFVSLGKATDIAENLQNFLLGPQFLFLVCFYAIEQHWKGHR
jgi:hypothetical protein